MKILSIDYDSTPKKMRSFSDYINVTIEYSSGMTGTAMITRAKYDRMMLQESIMKQYNVPEKVIEEFVEKCFDEERAEHVWDESD